MNLFVTLITVFGRDWWQFNSIKYYSMSHEPLENC